MTKYIYPMDEDVLELGDEYRGHFTTPAQYGGYFTDVFMEDDVQGGAGWGAILQGFRRAFTPVASFVKPLIKSGLKTLGKQALASAGGYIGDLATGADWKEAGKQRLGEAGAALSDKLQDKLARMAGAGAQFGGASNKRLQHAVKLFSFSPTAGASGTGCRRRRRKPTAGATAKGRRRRPVKRRRKAATTRRRRRQPVKRKRAASAPKRLRRAAPQRRRRTARSQALSQRGSGFDDFWL